MKNKILFFLLFTCAHSLHSQQSNSTFSRNYNIFLESKNHVISSSLHTGVKPFLLINLDSNIQNNEGSWFFRKWNKEHFIQE